MAEKAKNKKWTWTDRKYNVLLFLASVLSPWLMIMFLYTHNPTPPSGMAYVTIACVMVGYMAAWLIATKLLRSTIAATFLCFFATIHLWVFYRVFELLPQGNRVVLTLIKLAIFALIIGLLAFAGRKLQPKLQTAAPIILIVAGAVLVMNLIPVCERMWLKMSISGFTAETQEFYENKTYTVDETLASPNIYWIHCDGMLGFSSVEKYFGDEQTEFKQSLADRHFAINKTASFEARNATICAVNVLMNPGWYDAMLKEEIVSRKQELSKQIFISSYCEALSLGIDNNEMVKALGEKNYAVTTAQGAGVGVFPIDVDRTYYGEYVVSHSNSWIGVGANDFDGSYSGILVTAEDLLRKAINQMQQIPQETISQFNASGIRFNTMFRQISDIVNNTSETANLSLIWNFSSHFPFMYDENGALAGDGQSILAQDYLGTHRYAAKIAVDAVDMILEKDPDAIIVLQADHGLHELSADEIHEQLGTDAVPEEIWNQVLSAVRVPEQYQNEDFHYAMEDPRNISRWLINSFVGEQYEYLT